MSYTANNPYLLNIIPFYNVADPTNSATTDTTTTILTSLQGMIKTATNTVNADILQPFTSGQIITMNGSLNIVGTLSVDTLQSYTSGQTLTLNGPLHVTSTIVCQALYQTSDKRLKHAIRPLEGALSTLLELKGVSYTKDGKQQTGFIAQDVLEVLPDAVYKDQNGFYAVDYSRIIPLLVEAVKTICATST